MKMFAILDKAKSYTGNIRGLNLAAVMFTTVQVSRLPCIVYIYIYIYMVNV
jgi:hypothetical protein